MTEDRIQKTDRKTPRFIFSVFCLLSSVFCAASAHALPLIRDAEIENTLHVYADPILRTAGLKPSTVKIFIVNDDNLNAFVAGGANIFIHVGLIQATDSPDMLIGVIAHETGHIAGGHLAQGAEQLKNAQIGTILSYVLGTAAAVAAKSPEAAAAVITGGNSVVGRSFMAYSRAHEESADQAALGYLDRLNISASGLMKTFALLQRNERQHPRSPDPYMLTHPLSASRIEHMRGHLEKSKIPEGQYPKSYEIRHKRMLAKLYGFLQPPEKTLLKYPQGDKSVAARMARAIAYYKMPDLPRALAEMDSLIAESPQDPFLHELKGQILFENGRPADALASYETANKLLPDTPLLLVDLGKVELAQKPPGTMQAITRLEKATGMDPSNGDAWRLLATGYGKAGMTGMSYLALAEEAALENDIKRAIKQADLALSALKSGTPAHQRAQDLKARMLEIERKKKDDASPF